MRILKKLFFTFIFAAIAMQSYGQSLDEGQRLFDAKEYEQAFLILRPLAEEGDPQAQYLLGFMYTKGVGVEEDLHVAARWHTAAADQNHTKAMIQLSLRYVHGSGVPKNVQKAVLLLREAAALGDAGAMYNLARFYEMGRGVERDKQMALKWFIQSDLHGNPNAKTQIDLYKERGIVASNTTTTVKPVANVTPERFRKEFKRQARRLCNEIGGRAHAYRARPARAYTGCVLSGPTVYSDVDLELYFISAHCALISNGGSTKTRCTGEVSYYCRKQPSTSRGSGMVGQLCKRVKRLTMSAALDLKEDGRTVSFGIRVD